VCGSGIRNNVDGVLLAHDLEVTHRQKHGFAN
jgi:hypothetical protein